MSSFEVFDFHADEDLNSLNISAKHNAYKYSYNYLHQRTIKINKKNGNLSGEDKLITENNKISSDNTYCVRFHLYPGISAVQTMGKNSILIQIEKNNSLIFRANNENIALEKSIFLGRNQIINNSCITITGMLKHNENKTIYWEFKKNN
jgi:uncharacterized heparinase superfamily protein